ncbi:MAG: ATP-binding protein [Bryobacteraceae bacterium]
MSELKSQLASALLVILTVAAVICAGINFQQQKKFHLPEDGVTWVDRHGEDGELRVEALHLVDGGQAEKAGLRAGDILLRINGVQIENSLDVAKVLLRLGAWRKAEYTFQRDGVEAKATVYISETVPDSALYYQYAVGAAYLVIGLFVYFRRRSAPKALHFYVLCLVSFILSTFHYTGKFNNFDKAIYWGNIAAGVLAPTIFLHFCLVFADEGRRRFRGVRVALLYAPAALLLGVHFGVASGMVRVQAISLLELRWLLDRVWLSFLGLMYLAGAVALNIQYKRAQDTITRQQLKWLRNGAVFGVVPFAVFYIVPYLIGMVPGPYMRLAVLTLILIPLTWAYAIVRYRLMDVDIIFQQGYVHTLATISVLGIVYGLIFSLGKFDELSPTALIFLILIATFVFQPIRNWIQEVLDRYYFYKDRYDYRRTLIEFARELSSETDLDRMLNSVADRMLRTLSIQHVAFFIYDESAGRFTIKLQVGRHDSAIPDPDSLDLSFLPVEPNRPYLFFESTRHSLDVVSQYMPGSVRKTIADLDLTYYLPCSLRGRTIAYLGVSRTTEGDFLTSDDVELLMTLNGYVGIAIENARLYRSLQSKVEEYERLKEFSENIVESINVGILAADLNDRVESWNNQIERLTGIPRHLAVGRRLSELFPEELCERFDQVRGETGIHHIYKFVLKPQAMPFRAALRAAASNGNVAVYSNGNGSYAVDGADRPEREVTMNVAIAPLVSKELEQIGRLIIFDDVTDRAELERRLVQADKLSSIGLLAAGVAHEVNTPLAVISTYAQMLAKQVSGDDQKSRILEKIAKQTFRASEIVNGLLNFSRTSTTAYEELDLNRIVRETLGLIEHQLQKAGIGVALRLEQELPAVKGNPGKLQQVFLNLFLNARDAMEYGGSLSIRTWAEENTAHVEVADTGHGISPENLARIYDPFFTTKAARKGTGLGLAVSYGIVQEHGGNIEVHSQPGHGTRFCLDFPLARKPVNA